MGVCKLRMAKMIRNHTEKYLYGEEHVSSYMMSKLPDLQKFEAFRTVGKWCDSGSHWLTTEV